MTWQACNKIINEIEDMNPEVSDIHFSKAEGQLKVTLETQEEAQLLSDRFRGRVLTENGQQIEVRFDVTPP